MAKKVSKGKQDTQSRKQKLGFWQKLAKSFAVTGKKLKTFFTNLRSELKRVIWPDRKRLIQSTATVIAICLMCGVILFFIDSVLSGTLNAIGFYEPKPATVVTQPAPTESEPVVTEPAGSETTNDG